MILIDLRKAFVLVLCFFLPVGCNNSEEKDLGDTSPKIEKSDLVFLGLTVPFSIQEQVNSSAWTMGLSPHARVFFIRENVRFFDTVSGGREVAFYGSEFLQLLANSEEQDIPVKVYVYPDTNEICWVEEASVEEIERYEDAKQPLVENIDE